MKPLKLFFLVFVLIFLVVGCKKKEPESIQQTEVEVEEKPTQPSEPATQTESTISMHQASEKGDIEQVQLHIAGGH